MLTGAGNEWRPQHPDRLYPGDEEQLPVPLIVAHKAAARGLIVAGHHAPLAPLFVLLVLFLADLAPPFSFFYPPRLVAVDRASARHRPAGRLGRPFCFC